MATKGGLAVANPVYLDDDEEAGVGHRQDLLPSGRMDTIYESCEELMDSSDERSNSSNVYSSDTTSSGRGSADSPTGILRRSVRAWCDATGLPTTVIIEAKDRSFRLHKLPLVSRSGYLKRVLSDTSVFKLPEDFPGGSKVFQLVANFCYSSNVRLEPSNVAALRCSAEYLAMTEDYGSGNLCQKTESYLVEVVFTRWEDCMVVLEESLKLMPFAEQLLLVSRCIQSLAAAFCVEPVLKRRSSLSTARRQREDASLPKSLLELQPIFFSRFVGALRKQGMEERYATQIIMDYAKRWLLDFGGCAPGGVEETAERLAVLEAVVHLLPLERFVVPLGILFSLHGRAVAWEASNECRMQLEARIAAQLELATMEDLSMSMRAFGSKRVSSGHIDSMQRIVTGFMAQQQQMHVDGSALMLSERAPSYSFLAVSAVAKVWDEYLTEIASDPALSPRKFSELSDVVPTHIRTTHDQLYKAINIYLKLHKTISSSDRLVVTKALNCQKLSQAVCIHAVQNEHMPLRMIVQAMFMQQLQSRLPREEATYRQTERKQDDTPLGTILQRDAAFREASHLKDDVQTTKARLKELEQELVRMKRNVEEAERKQGVNHVDARNSKRFAGSCLCQVLGVQTNGSSLVERITRTFQKLGRGNFGKPRPIEERNHGKPTYEKEQDSSDNYLERASSFRRMGSDYQSNRSNTRHSRNHSFS